MYIIDDRKHIFQIYTLEKRKIYVIAENYGI